MCVECTRRHFLTSATIGGVALASRPFLASEDSPASAVTHMLRYPTTRVRICVIFAGGAPGKSWSLSESQIAPISHRLAQAEKNLGNVELIIGQATNAEQTKQLLQQAGPEAPILAISSDIFGLSRGVIPTALEEKRAIAVFHLPVIGGHDWCLVKPWREQGHRITSFNTTDFNDLEEAIRLLRVIPLLRRSRVLASQPLKGTPEPHNPDAVRQQLGVEVTNIPDGRYDEVMATVDSREAEARAEEWIQQAEHVVEPTKDDIVKAARASLTLERMLHENRACGLCVGTCMAWLPRGFPCLGFMRLNDNGFPAACDGDMDCLLTMLIMQHALNQPGFLGNAGSVDTSQNLFHLSHCSAPRKMDGPASPPAPFWLRRHAEVRGGAVPEVHYRPGQVVTFTKLVHLKTLLVFTGKIVQAPSVEKGKERGCRTELVAEVDNAEKLLDNWGGDALGNSATDYYASLHRVAYYGNQVRRIRHLARLLGLDVVEEC